MSVTVETPEPGGNEAVAAVAGAAAATAEVAREEAQEAEEVAQVADEKAEIAQETAISASTAAWDAQSAVAGLRSDMEAGFASIAALLAERKPDEPEDEPEPEPEPEDDKPGAPEKREKPAGAEPAPDSKPKRKVKWRADW